MKRIAPTTSNVDSDSLAAKKARILKALTSNSLSPALHPSNIEFSDPLAAKKARIHQALTSKTPSALVSTSNGSKLSQLSRSKIVPAKNIRFGKKQLPPGDVIIPVTAQSLKSTKSSSENNTIHGRKTISVREQQQRQMERTKEVITRLKAEQQNKQPSPSRHRKLHGP